MVALFHDSPDLPPILTDFKYAERAKPSGNLAVQKSMNFFHF
jgi:hypothetical protein